MDKIFVQYNGKRSNRVVNLRGGGKVTFFPERKILALNDYDAMLLLKSNIRLTPNTWEFSVIAVGSLERETGKIESETNVQAEQEVNEDSVNEVDEAGTKKWFKKKGGKK